MIDTHVHLNAEMFTDDAHEVILRARQAGITKMICVGFDPLTNSKAIQLAEKYPFIYATVGIHPTDASTATQADIDALYKLAKHPKVVAIGECGLDYYWDKIHHDKQKHILNAQIELSIAYDLPLVLHMRDASEALYNELMPYKGKIKGVMHCFSGSAEMAKKYMDLGLYISLGGPLTFLNAKAPKEVARLIPLDKLLIETDAPYLAPHPFRGKRNEPMYVTHVAQAMAKEKDVSIEEVVTRTTTNANHLFKLEAEQ